MKCYCNITYQSTCDSNALIIVSLQCPNEVLTKLIDVNSISQAVYESGESNQSVFCDSLE